MEMRLRLVTAAGAGLCAAFAFAGSASAQKCLRPNVPPSVVHAEQPRLRDLAPYLGSRVTVDVDLDESSRLTSARIANSPSPALNEPAVEAARNTVFQTEIRECLPIKSTVRLTVVFEPERPASAVFGGSADTPSLLVFERGHARRPPDTAVLHITFLSSGADARAASAADRTAYEGFGNSLQRFGVGDAVFTEQPVPISRGAVNFFVERQVSMRTEPRVGALHALQAASAAGASFASVQYAVSDDDGLYRDALQVAERSADLRARRSVAERGIALGARTKVEPAPDRRRAAGPVHSLRLDRDASPLVPAPPPFLEASAAVTIVYALRP